MRSNHVLCEWALQPPSLRSSTILLSSSHSARVRRGGRAPAPAAGLADWSPSDQHSQGPILLRPRCTCLWPPLHPAHPSLLLSSVPLNGNTSGPTQQPHRILKKPFPFWKLPFVPVAGFPSGMTTWQGCSTFPWHSGLQWEVSILSEGHSRTLLAPKQTYEEHI